MKTSPLRIAFIGQKGFPASWGGVEVHVEALAKRLARLGHEVTVYQRAWYTPRGTDTGPIRSRFIPTLRSKHADATWHSLGSSLDALFRGYDVVHFHALGPSLFSFVPRAGRAAVVVTVHGLDYGRSKWGRVARAALRLGERAAIHFADRLVVVSEELGAHFRGRHPETRVLLNGVDLPDLTTPALSPPLGLSPEGYLLFLGRWEENRHLVELIQGFLSLKDTDQKLVIAGADSDAGRYGQAVERAAQGSERILLPGWVEGTTKQALLRHARGIVSCSSHEGLPLALLEGMAWARPCVASDLSAHRELLGAGPRSERGMVLSMRDPAEIERALRRFLALTDAERGALGAAARAHVAQHHSWDRVVGDLEMIYREAIEQKQGG